MDAVRGLLGWGANFPMRWSHVRNARVPQHGRSLALKVILVTPDDVIKHAGGWVQTRLNNAIVREVVLATIQPGMSVQWYVELAVQYEGLRDQYDGAGNGAEVLKYESYLAGVVLRLQEVLGSTHS